MAIELNESQKNAVYYFEEKPLLIEAGPGSGKTRVIIERVKFLINDKETLEEMLVFVRNEKGRPEAQEGCHDDLVMALAIAFYIRIQQEMTVKVDIHELEYNIMKDFGFEEEVENEFGSKIEVI